MLWRFAFFVEGKHLEKVMSAIAGIALNMETPRPVSNGTVKQGKVVQKSSGTSQPLRVLEQLKHLNLQKGDKLMAAQIHDAMRGAELAKGNYGSIIARLKDMKYLKTTSTRGEYIITAQTGD